MKTMTVSNQRFLTRPVVPYPNAVTRRQFLHKLLDIALIAASGLGITAMLACLLIMG